MLARLVGDLASFVVDGVVFLIVAPGLVAWMTRGRACLHIRIHREGSMGYANRLIRLPFPDLTEDGAQEIFVTIRNPRTVPPDTLVVADLVDRPEGQQLTIDDALRGNATVVSRLIVAWHVYDGDDDSDDPAPLPLPATPELVRKLPREIIDAIMAEVNTGKATKPAPEASTSTTS
jgi:hypothetical protein